MWEASQDQRLPRHSHWACSLGSGRRSQIEGTQRDRLDEPIALSLADPARPSLVVVVIALSAAVGIGSEFVTRTNPFADLAANPGFSDYTARGWMLPVRALATLLVAIAVGAMVPRQLPALLLAGAATLALFVGLSIGMDAWMTAEARPIPFNEESRFGPFGGGPRIFDVAYREDATGGVITENDFTAATGTTSSCRTGSTRGFTQVAIGIPARSTGPGPCASRRSSGVALASGGRDAGGGAEAA
jgi:hypothetical protein